MEEEWKPVVGYEGLYEVSSLGRVKSLKFGRNKIQKILKISCLKNKGYSYVNLKINGEQITYRIHRLVALAFIPNPNNLPCACHKDEIQINGRLNNSVDNLWWGTHKENSDDKFLKGRANILCGINHPMKGKLGKDSFNSKKVNQYTKDGEFIRTWDCVREVERVLGIYNQNVGAVCLGKQKTSGGFIWKYS